MIERKQVRDVARTFRGVLHQRPRGAQKALAHEGPGGPRGPSPQEPWEPTRAQPARAQERPQGPGPQGPMGAHNGPAHKSPGGRQAPRELPQAPREANKDCEGRSRRSKKKRPHPYTCIRTDIYIYTYLGCSRSPKKSNYFCVGAQLCDAADISAM